MAELQAEARDPVETDIRMSCNAGHRWVERWPLPMTIPAFAKRMTAALKCPTCGAESFIGWPKETADV